MSIISDKLLLFRCIQHPIFSIEHPDETMERFWAACFHSIGEQRRAADKQRQHVEEKKEPFVMGLTGWQEDFG